MLLQRRRDRGFSGGAEAREPDCETALFAEGAALVAGEAFVPGYVTIWKSVLGVWWGWRGSTHVAIVKIFGGSEV